jgi:very-short-patch-repair endonuclease
VDLDRIASAQHGLITSAQLAHEGVSRSTVRNWRQAGRLVSVQPRVDRLAGAPVTYHQQVLAAVLSAGRGSAASHRAAGSIWRLYDGEPEVEIVVPRGRSARLRGVRVHWTTDDLPIVRRTGIPTTNPMRTIIDLGAVCPAHLVEDALDRALIDRLCTMAAVEWELARIARPGRRGAGVLHQVLDRRALGSGRPEGLLEARFAQLVKRYGLPEPVFQFEFGGFRIDFAFPHVLLAIEVDGYLAHASRAAFQADRERQNQLVAAGWAILRFTWEDVVCRPAKVAAAIQEAIARAYAAVAV